LAKSAKARAASAKAREIDAHRRAITMQEDATKFFDRMQEPDLSASARVRADNARELLRRALEEQAEMGTESQAEMGTESS
jgi:hypothetical protein